MYPLLTKHIYKSVIILLFLASRIAIAGTPQTIFFTEINNQNCNSAIPLIAVSTSGLPITFTFVQGKGKLTNNNLFTPYTPGKYVIKASQRGNANFDSAISITHEFLVTSNRQAEASNIVLSIKAPLCFGNAGDISVTSISGLSYKWILNNGSTNLEANLHINTIVSSLDCSGIISVIDGNCEILNLSLNLKVNTKTNVSFSVPDSVISGDTISLISIPPGGIFKGPGMIDSLFFSPTVLQKTTDTITYRYENIKGCISETQRIIAVYPKPIIAEIKPKVYEYITPNGDLKNDFFFIENIQMFPNNELIIFNGWGNELHREKGYINTWSPELVKGIYYYDFKVIDTGKRYTGHFYVSP
jgi:gliding motility-associated-like protein